MKITKTPANPAHFKFFEVTEYVIDGKCKGRIAIDATNGELGLPELWDGFSWYTVPPEVFDLWRRAYDLGVKDGRDAATERFID